MAAQNRFVHTPNPAVNMCLAVAFGFLILALIGLLVWIAPATKHATAAILLLAVNGAAARLNWRNREIAAALLHANAFMLGTWLCVSLSSCSSRRFPVRYAPTFPMAFIFGRNPYFISLLRKQQQGEWIP